VSGRLPYQLEELDDTTRLQRAQQLAATLSQRRSVRDFDSKPVAWEVIRAALAAACSAPSGANQQPWRFVAVSDPAVKRRIREAAEAEEREFYAHRATEEWLDALQPIGIDAEKPFLETAPWLIAIFVERSGVSPDGQKQKRYYPDESVGIALDAASTPESLLCFVRNERPELIYQHEVQQHPNGAQALEGVIICAENADQTAARYGTYTDSAPEEIAAGLFRCSLRWGVVLIGTATALKNHFGNEGTLSVSPEPRSVGVMIARRESPDTSTRSEILWF